jgi:hypothetical protein
MKLHGTDITASENHCNRTSEVKNSNKELTYLNFNSKPYQSSEMKEKNLSELKTEAENEKFWKTSMPLKLAIDDYINTNDIKIPRKDSVKCIELMLAAPPELFKDKNREELAQNSVFKAWKEANYEFIRKEFKIDTKEPVMSFYVHLDEETPHIHAHVVPIHYNDKKKQYEVNAKAKFGGFEKMQEFQNRYHKAINENFQNIYKYPSVDSKTFEFQRGIPKEKTGKKHVQIKDYYKAIEKAAKLGVTPEQIEKLIEQEFPKSKEISPSKMFDLDQEERVKKPTKNQGFEMGF